MGFIAHHEREGGGIGDGMGGRVVSKFCHREKFGPFRRLVFRKVLKEGLKFLIDPFRFAISLRMIGSGEGDVII